MTKLKKWSLLKEEVREDFRSSTRSGRFSNRSRKSRASDLRDITVRLKHLPTGVIVERYIAEGFYTKKEVRRQKIKMAKELFVLLEDKVAKKLRIPGR